MLGELLGQVAVRFGRVEPWRTAERMVRGLLAKLPRKNCWTLAEHVGDVRPDAIQHRLARAVWGPRRVRDDLRGAVVERLGTDSAVLVLDETDDLKKGTMTVATQRQYTGTAGRIENAQIAVFAVWATPRGAAFIDRALYVPQVWIDDPERCAAAGLPGDTVFAPSPNWLRTSSDPAWRRATGRAG